ncbi:MAG: hypothetical protein EP330_09850 [Deltaproteobacteria bacterium]|nr:MAG: hypothetical protein EP330_09850 [Deltaproteobacteria bacterium]
MDEAELLRRALSAPVLSADLEAVGAQTLADRTAVPLLDSPALEARHEEAKGDWGATTNAVGASVTVDLGLSPLSYTRAGRLRGDAGERRRDAVALDLACGLRADATDLWAASDSAMVSEAAQGRLEELLQTLTALAEAGEASGYDRDRTTLAVVAHLTEAQDRAGTAETLRARVSALVGEPVDEVQLAPVSETPTLDASLEALAGHPSLDGLSLERDAAKASRDAARRDQLPDLTLSGGPRWDSAPTGGPSSQGFEVGGAVQIPWTDGSRAESRQQAADLAAAEARLLRARAELESAVRAAHRRVEALRSSAVVASDPEVVWTAAFDRYTAGESSLDDLLQVAEAVEAARLATIERERLLRRAYLDLSCATGRFADPTLQSVLEEAVR